MALGPFSGKWKLTDAVCISVPLVAAVFVIYRKGPTMRKRSPFAQQLSDARQELQAQYAQRGARMPEATRANSIARSQQNIRVHQALGSHHGSTAGSRPSSRGAYDADSRRNSEVAG